MKPAPAIRTSGDTGPLGPEQAPERSWHSRLSSALMLPREHGAWAMLLMPYLLGTAAAGWESWPSFLLLAAILAFFTASRPLELLVQGKRSGALPRLIAYGLVGYSAGLALLALYGRWMLLPLAAIAGLVLGAQLPLRRRRLERIWAARLASIAALSATGPAAYYASSGVLDVRAIAVWILACLYSGASVFYVRLYYRAPAKKGVSALEGRVRAERRMAAYVALVLAATAGLSAAGLLPPLALVAFAPLAVKVGLACRERRSRPTLRRIGYTEIAHSALFLLLAATAMRLWA